MKEEMLYEEFLQGTDNEERGRLESVKVAYEIINKAYMADTGGFRSKEDCYEQYRRSRWEFDWIDSPDIGNGVTLVNTCTEEISAEEAADVINEQFGFEKDKIVICGKAYYDATDWNFIRFTVNGYAYTLCGDSLHIILR